MCVWGDRPDGDGLSGHGPHEPGPPADRPIWSLDRGPVDGDAIAQVLSRWTGIPVTALTQDEASRLLHLEGALHRRVIGQKTAVHSIASAILTESSLSYLGFGISIPNPSWGGMLEGAQTYILTHPSLAVYPGVCILLTVLCFNVLGNGFRRRFSPNSGR